MRLITVLFFIHGAFCGLSQSNPAITSWKINNSGSTGFAGIPTNVQQVQYSTSNVYITTNDIADWIPVGYDWPNNPWSPEAQNFVFKISLNPVEKINNKVITPYGHIGLWVNGVSIYNPKDAKSWKDSAVWFQNALFFEHEDLQTFDECLGHPNNMHEYHTHVNPTCLYDDTDSTQHSPIIGFAFDGFPIYGAYGFSETNGMGAIKRMRSSYRKRVMSDRSSLPDGTVLPATLQGPPFSLYPSGAYVEDYEYIPGLGDLDEYNGRFCKTPEYPNGIYAYFVTIDENLYPEYPYVVGPKFYGVVQMGNMGPNSGHNTINEPVVVFTSVNDIGSEIVFQTWPNPAGSTVDFFVIPGYTANMTATLVNESGGILKAIPNIQTAVAYTVDIQHIPSGNYFLIIGDGKSIATKKVVIAH